LWDLILYKLGLVKYYKHTLKYPYSTLSVVSKDTGHPECFIFPQPFIHGDGKPYPEYSYEEITRKEYHEFD
jgi:hypothetical protein